MFIHRPLAAILVLLTIPVLTLHSQTSDSPTIIIVLRHAEKNASEGNDPVLSARGYERARALADVVAAADVGAVYTTQYKRTVETATPLVEKLGLSPTILPVTSATAIAYDSLLAANILAKHRGRTVVVVGHSNTVPALVARLTGLTVEPIPESEYDRLYTVILPPTGRARLVAGRYGRGAGE